MGRLSGFRNWSMRSEDSDLNDWEAQGLKDNDI